MTRMSDAVLQEVRGEGMAQRVRPDALGDLGGPSRLGHDAVDLAGGDRSIPALPGNSQPSR